MVTYRVPWYETVQLTMVMVRIVADFMVVPLPWYGQGPATMVMVRAGGSYQTMVMVVYHYHVYCGDSVRDVGAPRLRCLRDTRLDS